MKNPLENEGQTFPKILPYINSATIDFYSYGQTTDIKDSSRESVYLHTDRSHYFAGESIFFKAYILKDLSNRYNSLNNELYVALIDQDGLEVASENFG